MNEHNEKNIIIAKRIQLKFVSEIIAYCICFVLLAVFLGLFIWLDSLAFIIIFGLLMNGIVIYAVFDLRNIYVNNHSNPILITYKNDTFTIVDEIVPLHIKQSDIVDLNYKLKKSFIVTPYFFSEQTLNYGKLVIWFNNEGEGYKLTIKNVADVDKVFDKLVDVLGWNTIEDDELQI